MAREVIAGPCSGGPYDGQQIAVRFPKGFVLVHEDSLVTIYDWIAGEFVARETRIEDPEKLMAAAEGPDYDVVVA